MDIRENLKNVIEEKGYMQSAIARKSKLSPYKLSMVLNKQRKLDANELFDVCDAIDMTPTELREYKSIGSEKR